MGAPWHPHPQKGEPKPQQRRKRRGAREVGSATACGAAGRWVLGAGGDGDSVGDPRGTQPGPPGGLPAPPVLVKLGLAPSSRWGSGNVVGTSGPGAAGFCRGSWQGWGLSAPSHPHRGDPECLKCEHPAPAPPPSPLLALNQCPDWCWGLAGTGTLVLGWAGSGREIIFFPFLAISQPSGLNPLPGQR